MTGDGAASETLRLLVALPFALALLWAAVTYRFVASCLKAALALAWCAATVGLAAWSMTLPVNGTWNQLGALLGAFLVGASWFYLGGRALLREAVRELFPRST